MFRVSMRTFGIIVICLHNSLTTSDQFIVCDCVMCMWLSIFGAIQLPSSLLMFTSNRMSFEWKRERNSLYAIFQSVEMDVTETITTTTTRTANCYPCRLTIFGSMGFECWTFRPTHFRFFSFFRRRFFVDVVVVGGAHPVATKAHYFVSLDEQTWATRSAVYFTFMICSSLSGMFAWTATLLLYLSNISIDARRA